MEWPLWRVSRGLWMASVDVIKYVSVFLCVLLGATVAQASVSSDAGGTPPGLQLQANMPPTSLAGQVYRADDSHAIQTPESALARWHQGQFRPHPGERLTTDLTRMPEWFGFYLHPGDPGLSGREWMISTQDVMHLTRVTLYVPVVQEGRAVYRLVEDSLHNLQQRPTGSPISTFLIDQSFDGSRPFFIKVAGKLSLNAPLIVQSRSDAAWEASVRIAFICIAFGAILGLGIYNLVLYFFVGDRVYLLYVGYALSMLVWQMQISGFFFVLDREFAEAFYAWVTPNFVAGVANLMGSLFTVSFLRLRQQNQWQGVAVMAVAIINLAIGVITQTDLTGPIYERLHRLQFLFSGISALVIVLPTMVLVWRGYRFAWPFIIAWGFLGTGITLLAVGYQPVIFGVVFPRGFNVLSCVAIEMILMSYALGLRIKAIQTEAVRLETLSVTDGLTGLYNQRHLHTLAPELIETRSLPTGQSWAYVVIDIDHFKSFNDNYGHTLGDRVLQLLSETIRAHIRHEDYAFRAGGEEFVLLMAVREFAQAQAVVERIRESFHQQIIQADDNRRVRCSLSAGVAMQTDGESARELFELADQALYRAKDAGRNQVVFA